jgi:prepilin-type N-terminal cleavage/methylation domain-containing protein
MNDKPRPTNGFTLVELMVAVAIIAVITLSAAASIIRRMPDIRLTRAVDQVSTDLRLARMRAASLNAPVQISFNNDADTYTVWADKNRNQSKDAGEVETFSLDVAPNQNMWAYPTTGTFQPDGTFETASSYAYIAVASPDAGYKYVYVFPSGQVDPHNL